MKELADSAAARLGLSRATRIAEPKTAPGRRQWQELFRFADGKWLPADGTADIAFGGRSEDGFPYAISFATYSYDNANATNKAHRVAMDWVCSRYRCANGRRAKKDGTYA